MTDKPNQVSWWQTLPGALTALAGLVTAVGGMVLVLSQIGFFGHSKNTPPKPENADATTARPIDKVPGSDETKASGEGKDGVHDESRQLLESVRLAVCPNKNALRSVKAIQQEQTRIIDITPSSENRIASELLLVIGVQEVERVHVPQSGAEVRHVVTQAAGFTVYGTEVHDDDRWARERDLKSLKRNLFNILQNADNNLQFHFTSIGVQEIQGVQTKVLEIDADGAKLQWFVDPGSGRILRSSYWEESRRNESQRVDIDYSDWRTVGGMTVPFRSIELRDGKKMFAIDLSEVRFNPLVDPSLFGKP